MPSEIEKKKSKTTDVISAVLEETLGQVVQGITGLAASEKKDLVMSFSRVLRNLRGGQFLGVLKEEWDEMREKGKIKEDYATTDQGFSCLQEILDFLEASAPDEKRFRAAKALFFNIAQESMSKRDEILPLTLLKVLKQLDTTELVILFTAYRCYRANKPEYVKVTGAIEWSSIIAKESGLNYGSAVDLAEEKLTKLCLIGGRIYVDRSGMAETKTFRLTGLAIELCEFIAQQDPGLIFKENEK